MNGELYDVTIVGGGPIGLFASFYGGMRQLKVKIIESLPQLGGQLAALYPEKNIYDVAGFPKVKAQDLVDHLKEQALYFKPAVVLGETVQEFERLDDGTFRLMTDKNIHYTKTILITAGIGSFQPRKLNLENAAVYEEKNLHYFVQNVNRFQGKKVCILGGGDSAVDWALTLESVASHVTLVHRRNKFRAHEASVEQLKNSRVEILTPYTITGLSGGEEIEAVTLEHTETKETINVELDELIVNYGFVSSLGPLKKWGLNLHKNSIVTNASMETNIEGIYAAGDIVHYEGKVKLIVTGFGDAATAISSIKAYVDPDARKQPQHSTSIFEKLTVKQRERVLWPT